MFTLPAKDLVVSLTRLVEVKDHCTAAHTWRVALYTQAVAEAMGLSDEETFRMMRAAALHDLGKIDIPSRILSKPSPLTPDEVAIIQTHPTLGYERLVRMQEADPIVLALVRSHHERVDGTGYPDAIGGNEIPFAARVFAVIDAFDAMTSIRPYRRDTGSSAAARAIEEIQSKAGSWYCKEAVQVFTALIESGQLRWIQRHYNDQKSLDGLGSPSSVEEIDIGGRRFASMDACCFASEIDRR